MQLLPAATKLGQGNIFTSVCQEFCPQGGGCLPQCMLGYTPRSRHHPPPQTRYTPRTRHTSPPDQAHLPPRADTPLGSRLQHTVNERPVRILLECILVFTISLGCKSFRLRDLPQIQTSPIISYSQLRACENHSY